ncbi:hypothetical protein ACKXF7_14840 [Faecalibacterium sp. 7]|uniref:hypothetical protein n=1 Tax=Faecalibacterium sp. 7 TaxID=3402017 RepID=UPI003C2D765E
MKSEHLVGTSIPRFTFDTPTTPGNDFYKLCEGEHPLVMIFLPAFDHPVTREYLTRYLQTLPRLRGVRLACVVHSSPRTVAKATQGAEFPFTLICDAPGVLYGYLGVEQARGILSWSFAAQRIYKAAREQGYRYDSSAPQLLPLTLVVGHQGSIPVHPLRPQPDRPARGLRRHPGDHPRGGAHHGRGPAACTSPLLGRDAHPAGSGRLGRFGRKQ